MISKQIENIILQDDFRGMKNLKEFMPKDYLSRSSDLLLQSKGEILIVSGFYILNSKSPETDGPPGAVAISNALNNIGIKTSFVTDNYSYKVMKALAGDTEVINFPITSHRESALFSENLLNSKDIGGILSIERAGLLSDGTYRNWKGEDFSKYNAKIDHLFELHPNTIGIGDGGNEIGMGNLKEIIPNIKNLPKDPCITTAKELIIASCYNWGGYGLVADISIKKGVNLLPSVNEALNLVEKSVKFGAVEGMSGDSKNWVDGRSPEDDSVCLKDLIRLVESNIY